MKFAYLACLIALSGLVVSISACERPMSNDEIITEVRKCNLAGMDAALLSSLASGDRVQAVECRMRAR